MDFLTTCPSCGGNLADGAKFCSSCGAKREDYVESSTTNHICKRCGTELELNQFFCPCCGKRRQNSTAPRGENRSIVNWITHSVSLIVALFFIILAFSPTIVYKDIEISDDVGKVDFSLSAIDNILLCFDAMRALDDDELYDSNLYEKFEELTENSDDLSKKEARQILKLVCRLNLQREETTFLPQYAISATISLIYILFALIFLAVTTTDFVFFAIGQGKCQLSRAVLTMLAAIPALALASSLTFSTSFNLNQAYKSSLSGAVITLTVISLLALAFLTVKHYFFDKKRPAVSVKAIVKRSLALVASILMMLSVLLPLASYEVKATFEGSSKPTKLSRELDISFFENFALSESELEMYQDVTISDIKKAAEYYEYFSKKEFKEGATYTNDTRILVSAFTSFGGDGVVGLISLVPLYIIIASIVGALLLWQNLSALISNASPHGAITIPLKIVGAISAILALALVMVFVFVAGFNLNDIKFENVKPALSISIGAFFIPAFSIFAAAVPMGKRKERI